MGSIGWGLLAVSIFSLNLACNSGLDRKRNSSISSEMACKDGVLQMPAGIFGGQSLKEDSEFARGAVFILYKTGEKDAKGKPATRMCTGTLIDQNIVLSAAHCMPPSGNPDQMWVAFSLDPICQVDAMGEEKALRKVEKVISHPGYAEKEDGDLSDEDLMMLRFEGQAPSGKKVVKPLTQHVELNESSEIQLVGYGQMADFNEKSDQERVLLRSTAVQPLLQSSATAKITQDNSGKVLYFDQSKGHGACNGDSGGPALLKVNGELRLLGVNSAVDTLGADEFAEQAQVTCHQGLRSLSVLAHRDWILSTHGELKNSKSIGMPLE